MILGRGSARTEKAIIVEYYNFLEESGDNQTSTILERLKDAPEIMCRRIGKPISKWQDEDIFALFLDRQKTTLYCYKAFLAFLIFRGYRQASLRFITHFFEFSRLHRRALVPFRKKLEKTQHDLGYLSHDIGSELNLLIALLAVVHKPLNELTRLDFDTFRDMHQNWYRETQRRRDGQPNAHLSRLEYCLVHWNIIPAATRVFKHEQHFARLKHSSVRSAISIFMNWCDAKYQPSSIDSRRAALLNFFLWCQDINPSRDRLDDVTRPIALAYAKQLKHEHETGHYSQNYCNDMYNSLRLFFDFVIREDVNTSPHRNPFALGDMPRRPDSIPRYLTDQETHSVLAYCDKDASQKERTFVIILLHTGVRAAELASLKSSDIVQIQGKWKLHIHEGKGLKDRVIPLTPKCLETLQAWQKNGWSGNSDNLFTWHGRPVHGPSVSTIISDVGRKVGITQLTPHRFRHTFAVTLLNYGMRETALQKVMGHSTLQMTLEYARILDPTVEQSFAAAMSKMQDGPIQWIPNLFNTNDYSLFTEDNNLNWIRLPLGFCRRSPQLHCESDIKCLLCDRFKAVKEDIPRFKVMCDRFHSLGMHTKAQIIAEKMYYLETRSDDCIVAGVSET